MGYSVKDRESKTAESEVQSMRTATEAKKITALYERLGQDGELTGESNSIKNQK